MPIQRPWLPSILLSLAAAIATPVSATGFAASGSGAVLGQPLNFAVQLRLDPGDALSPECVSAEVTAGDRRVPPPLVRTQLEMVGADSARIRVITTQGIDEPVIGVDLHVGCGSRITRRFVVLADPPSNTPSAPLVLPAVPAELPAAPPSATAPSPDAQPTASVAGPAAGLASVAGAEPPRAAPPARRALARADRRAPAPRANRTRRTAATAPAPAPRLQLDLMEPVSTAEAAAVEQAIAAVAQAASAARAAASAASASAERIATLERTVVDLRAQAQASADEAAMLRERLVHEQGGSRWLLPLMVAVGLLAAMTAWLAWRLSALQRRQQELWSKATAAAVAVPPPVSELTPSKLPTRPIPFVTSEIGPAPARPQNARRRAAPAWPPASPADDWASDSAVARLDGLQPRGGSTAADIPIEPDEASTLPGQRTEVLPTRVVTEASPAPRDVSIEELIDLEQQAEFFVVLGQDEAAIDLLVDHLRNTGGGSPLPYLKLLEIYHRRGDLEAYERMRTRFNHRFNAYAPEWGSDLHGGRSLEDYPGVLPRLQQVWPRPLDAMAELEALLFRKSRGELFDLLAYREVLFLYSLARDLLDREAADTGDVDLLLPLADGGDFSSTSPAPFLGLEPGAGQAPRADFDSRPTSPVDFDISAAERPSSIFDRLEQTQPLPPRG